MIVPNNISTHTKSVTEKIGRSIRWKLNHDNDVLVAIHHKYQLYNINIDKTIPEEEDQMLMDVLMSKDKYGSDLRSYGNKIKITLLIKRVIDATRYTPEWRTRKLWVTPYEPIIDSLLQHAYIASKITTENKDGNDI